MAHNGESSSSFNSITEKCICGVLCQIQTSWTEDNLGRRFLGCGRYGTKNSCCDFFRWYDAHPTKRFQKVISGLLRKSKAVGEEVEALQKKNITLMEEIEEQVAQLYLLQERIGLQRAQLQKFRVVLLALVILIIGLYFSR